MQTRLRSSSILTCDADPPTHPPRGHQLAPCLINVLGVQSLYCHVARHGIQVAFCSAAQRRSPRARVLARLHHQHGHAQPAQNTIAAGKILRRGKRPHRTSLTMAPPQLESPLPASGSPWVHHVDPVPHTASVGMRAASAPLCAQESMPRAIPLTISSRAPPDRATASPPRPIHTEWDAACPPRQSPAGSAALRRRDP